MRRNRQWFLGLTCLTAFVLILWGHNPSAQLGQAPTLELPAQAQTQPAAPPRPIPTTPTQAVPPPPRVQLAPPLPMSGTYRDPGGRYQIGILDGYKVSALTNAPLFEAPSGRLAYTVVMPAATAGQGTVNHQVLAQIAQASFSQGEGFKPQPFQVLTEGEILIPWQGSLTVGGRPQPISGTILARQVQGKVYVVLVSATQPGEAQLEGAIAALANSLQPLTEPQ